MLQTYTVKYVHYVSIKPGKKMLKTWWGPALPSNRTCSPCLPEPPRLPTTHQHQSHSEPHPCYEN